jgi:acyl carrier protein
MDQQFDLEIYRQVVDAIATGLSVDRARISLDTSLRDDLGADSMDLVSLTVILEEAFPDWNGTIDEDSFARLRTVRDVVRFVEQLAPSG